MTDVETSAGAYPDGLWDQVLLEEMLALATARHGDGPQVLRFPELE